jgi:hypothetical protein
MPFARYTGSKHADPRPLVEREIVAPGCELRQNSAIRPLRTVTVNLAESPLAWLHTRGHLDDRQLLAGEKLRGDYERAQMGPRVTMCWDNTPIGRTRRAAPSPVDASEAILYAKQRFDTAITALGADLSGIAWRVICAGESMPVAEKSMGWPNRSGKVVLRIALNRLADHYRLPG